MYIQEQALRRVIAAIVRCGGSDEAETEIVVDHLVKANLAGHDSHGVGMIPAYIEHLKAGTLHPNTAVRLVKDDNAIMIFDGGSGYGQRVAREAMEAAIVRCREAGVVVFGLRNAHHIGRIGSYGEQSIAAGLVSLHFVNVTDHRPLVAPFGGSDARFATNPICIAMPGTANTEPVLLDMATSKIALGKVRVAMNKGEHVADNVLINHQGQATTDPNVMFNEPAGALLPIGEHKGYGLALFCELLGGLLSGGGTIQPANPRHGSIINHMLTFIVDPGRLVDLGWMQAELDAMVAYVKASPAANPDNAVMVAGEPERKARARRQSEGIPMDDTTWEEILVAGEKVGLARAEAFALVEQ